MRDSDKIVCLLHTLYSFSMFVIRVAAQANATPSKTGRSHQHQRIDSNSPTSAGGRVVKYADKLRHLSSTGQLHHSTSPVSTIRHATTSISANGSNNVHDRRSSALPILSYGSHTQLVSQNSTTNPASIHNGLPLQPQISQTFRGRRSSRSSDIFADHTRPTSGVPIPSSSPYTPSAGRAAVVTASHTPYKTTHMRRGSLTSATSAGHLRTRSGSPVPSSQRSNKSSPGRGPPESLHARSGSEMADGDPPVLERVVSEMPAFRLGRRGSTSKTMHQRSQSQSNANPQSWHSPSFVHALSSTDQQHAAVTMHLTPSSSGTMIPSLLTHASRAVSNHDVLSHESKNSASITDAASLQHRKSVEYETTPLTGQSDSTSIDAIQHTNSISLALEAEQSDVQMHYQTHSPTTGNISSPGNDNFGQKKAMFGNRAIRRALGARRAPPMLELTVVEEGQRSVDHTPQGNLHSIDLTGSCQSPVPLSTATATPVSTMVGYPIHTTTETVSHGSSLAVLISTDDPTVVTESKKQYQFDTATQNWNSPDKPISLAVGSVMIGSFHPDTKNENNGYEEKEYTHTAVTLRSDMQHMNDHFTSDDEDSIKDRVSATLLAWPMLMQGKQSMEDVSLPVAEIEVGQISAASNVGDQLHDDQICSGETESVMIPYRSVDEMHGQPVIDNGSLEAATAAAAASIGLEYADYNVLRETADSVESPAVSTTTTVTTVTINQRTVTSIAVTNNSAVESLPAQQHAAIQHTTKAVAETFSGHENIRASASTPAAAANNEYRIFLSKDTLTNHDMKSESFSRAVSFVQNERNSEETNRRFRSISSQIPSLNNCLSADQLQSPQIYNSMDAATPVESQQQSVLASAFARSKPSRIDPIDHTFIEDGHVVSSKQMLIPAPPEKVFTTEQNHGQPATVTPSHQKAITTSGNSLNSQNREQGSGDNQDDSPTPEYTDLPELQHQSHRSSWLMNVHHALASVFAKSVQTVNTVVNGGKTDTADDLADTFDFLLQAKAEQELAERMESIDFEHPSLNEDLDDDNLGGTKDFHVPSRSTSRTPLPILRRLSTSPIKVLSSTRFEILKPPRKLSSTIDLDSEFSPAHERHRLSVIRKSASIVPAYSRAVSTVLNASGSEGSKTYPEHLHTGYACWNRFLAIIAWPSIKRYFVAYLSHKWRSYGICLSIIVSTVVAANLAPMTDPTTSVNRTWLGIDIFLQALFLADMLIQWTIFGIFFAPSAYFRSKLHWLDTTVFVCTMLDHIYTWNLLGTDNPTRSLVLRALRCLRPLRFCGYSENTSLLIRSFSAALPSLGNVCLVSLVCLLVLAILGMRLFKGAYYRSVHAMCTNPVCIR